MPTITPETPRADRSIGGVTVSVPQPYAAGHTLTEGEASQLNQVYAENASNNLRDKIKLGAVSGEGENQTSTPHTSATAQPLVDKWASEYEMGVRRGGGGEARVTDPVEKEARSIARQKATQLVKEAGMKPADVNMAEIAGQVFDGNRDLLIKEAQKIVDARAKAQGKDGLTFEGISLTPKAPAADASASA